MLAKTKDKIFDLLLIFLLGLVPLLWYKPGYLALGHDMGFPLNPIGIFFDRLFTWTEGLGFGFDQTMTLGGFFIHGFEALIKWLGFSLQTTQKISFVFWFVTPGLAMYYFICSLGFHKKLRFFPLIAAIFYMFNHFLLQAWFMAERPKFSIVVALPLVLSFLIRGLERKFSLLKTAILINLVLFFLNGGGGAGLALYGGLIISVAVCSIYFALLRWQQTGVRELGRNFVLIFIILVIFIILNFYWTLPFGSSVLGRHYQRMGFSEEVEGVLHWTHDLSRHTSFLNIFRLQGIPSWYDDPSHAYTNDFLKNPLLIFLSFVWPILAFGSVFLVRDKKEKKYVLFFIFLVLFSMIFIAGTHPPTGVIYEMLLRHLPFFVIFRTPFYKFGYVIWFAYAFLISFTISRLSQSLKKWPRCLLCLIFILFILLYNCPFFTGAFFNWRPPLSTMVKPPDYVFEFGKWLDSLEKKERVLMLPPLNKAWRADTYNWHYWSLTSLPSLLTKKAVLVNSTNLGDNEEALIYTLYDALLEGNEALAKKLSALFNIKYFLLRKDFFYDLDWCSAVSPEKYHEVIEDFSWVNLEHHFGNWLVYRLETDDFLPRFYLSTKDKFFISEVGNMEAFADFETGDFGTSFPFSVLENKRFLSEFGLSSNVFIFGQCIRCNLSKDKFRPQLPPITFLPSSIFYPLITWREKMFEEKIKQLGDPAELVSLNLGLASKRLAELSQLVEKKREAEKIEEAIEDYGARIGEAARRLEKVDQDNFGIFLVVDDYFSFHKENLRTLLEKEMSYQANILIRDAFWQLDEFLSEIRKKEWISEKHVRRYVLEIPQEDEYELMVKREEEWQDILTADPFDPLVFSLDGEEIIIEKKETKTNWFSLGRHQLVKGKHRLAIFLPDFINLAHQESFVFSTDQQGYDLVFPVKSLGADKEHSISFFYRAESGQPPRLVVLQDTDEVDKEFPGVIRHSVDSTLIARGYWQKYETFFKPDPEAEKVSVNLFFSKSTEKGSVVSFEDFEINRMWSPKVMLKKVIDEKSLPREKKPQITFARINPTLYEAWAQGVENPYILVFSEAFHRDWKVWIVGEAEDDIKTEEVIASYFNGEIKEEKHKTDFVHKKIFASWFKKSIPEERHFSASGYANSWLITPEDSAGKKNYRLIIEFWPQRLFYVGILISCLTFSGCVGYLFLTKEKK